MPSLPKTPVSGLPSPTTYHNRPSNQDKDNSNLESLPPVIVHVLETAQEPTTQQVESFKLKRSVVNLGCRVLVNDTGRVKVAYTLGRKSRSETPFPIGSYKCNHCHKTFFESLKLRHHILKQHLSKNGDPQKPEYKCMECLKSFCLLTRLNSHWKTHLAIKKFPCPQPDCPAAFVTTQLLLSHSVVHSKGWPYQCKICKRNFKAKKWLEIHRDRLKKRGSKLFKCEICQLKICHPGAFNSHMRDHQNPERTRIKFYYCKICGETVLRKLQKKHRQSHRVDKLPYHCTFCSKSFKEHLTLEVHTRFHTGEKPYECQVCKKQFSQTSNLRTHSKVHLNRKKQFQCQLCFRKINSEVGFRKHEMMCGKISEYAIEIHSPYIPGKTGTSSAKRSVVSYQCRQCNSKIFKRKEYLQNHVFRHHLKIKFYKCSYCKMEFVHPTELQSHLRSHTGEEPFKCTICGKGFKQSTHLKSHALIHSESLEDKKFRCFFCLKSFNRVGYLNGHIRLHTKERPYKCNHCPMAFDRSEVLKRHINNHTGNRAFKCTEDGCSKAFLSNAELRGHKMTHTDERPFPCLVCDIACRNKGKLKQHYESQSHKELARKLEKTKGVPKITSDRKKTGRYSEKQNVSVAYKTNI